MQPTQGLDRVRDAVSERQALGAVADLELDLWAQPSPDGDQLGRDVDAAVADLSVEGGPDVREAAGGTADVEDRVRASGEPGQKAAFRRVEILGPMPPRLVEAGQRLAARWLTRGNRHGAVTSEARRRSSRAAPTA